MGEVFWTILLLIVVIVSQFIFFSKTKRSCTSLSELFPGVFNSEGSKLLDVKESLIHYETKEIVKESDEFYEAELRNVHLLFIESSEKKNVSKEFLGILSATNNYLKHNSDTTADFNILHDIAERVSEAEESKVAAGVAIPLYIGLMGTFIGVIFGVVNLLTSGSVESTINDESIRSFLSGVIIAMVGSLFGLLLTTINASYSFKEAKKQRDKAKNGYFNFLQTKLLPTLENTLGKNLREFKENLSAFNSEFSENLVDFKGTIPSITDNLKLQTQFIKDFQKLDLQKIANANVQIFDKLTASTATFEKYVRFTDKLNTSLETTDAVISKLTSLLDRLSKFENNISNIGDLIQKNDFYYGKVADFIQSRLKTLEDSYNRISTFIATSENDLSDFLNAYKDRMQNLSQKILGTVSETFDITDEHNPFSKLKYLEALNNGIDNQLKKLDTLEQLNKSLQEISRKLDRNNEQKENKNNGSLNNRELIAAIENLNHSVNSLKRSIRPSIFKPKLFFRYIFSNN
jgi:hypothetical protein